MVDKSSLGAEGAPFEMQIEAGKIHEFARALGAEHPDHTGWDPVIPSTFLTTQFFWEARVEGANPWDLVQMSQERGMHAEQEYIFHGPPPTAGTRLQTTATHARRTLALQAVNQDGVVVVQGWTTFVR